MVAVVTVTVVVVTAVVVVTVVVVAVTVISCSSKNPRLQKLGQQNLAEI